MGILNVTPDSFSDGGCFATPESALCRALEMLDQGADILDIGGESTRPGSTPLSSSDEQKRVLPVISAVLKARAHAIISVDTYHADTARVAVQSGVEIVNDVSGHLWDPQMATRGRPADWKLQPPLAPEEVVPLVLEGLQNHAQHAVDAGVNPSKIVLDPGFGFGKIRGENYPLLAGFSQLNSLGFPLLAGLSRKSFLRPPNSDATGPETDASVLAATIAANNIAILSGAHILRVHDVAEARAAADLADAILSAGPVG
jgi:dihydropteroate synthase